MLRKISFSPLFLFLFLAAAGCSLSCSAPKPNRVLTISEQIAVDTQAAQALFSDFQKKVTFINFPEGERYLNAVTKKIAKVQDGFSYETVRVRIHQDNQKSLSHFFSFPGTTISVPLSYLKQVEYENELAAVLAYEIANVMNRHLAKKLADPAAGQVENQSMFGTNGLFELNRAERKESIQLGTRLLYYAGFEPRGLASVFQRYPQYFTNFSSDLAKKEVDFNIRAAQQARSEYLPSLSPIVRSSEFITMKKGIAHL